jgi:hypothetical protein
VRRGLRACTACRRARLDGGAGLAAGQLPDTDGQQDGGNDGRPAAGTEPEQVPPRARAPVPVTALPGCHGTRLY